MKRTPWIVLLTALALALSLLAGCGGSQPPALPTPAPDEQTAPPVSSATAPDGQTVPPLSPATAPDGQPAPMSPDITLAPPPPAGAPAQDTAPQENSSSPVEDRPFPEAIPAPAASSSSAEPSHPSEPEAPGSQQPAPDGQPESPAPEISPADHTGTPAPAPSATPNPLPTEPTSLGAAPEDGSYTASVTLEGGTGRASVASPAQLRCENGQFWATIVWSSPNFDYMKVDGVKYELLNTQGNSTFEIPVAAFDQTLDVIADTVAMSEPHEVAYTLRFDSASLQKQ